MVIILPSVSVDGCYLPHSTNYLNIFYSLKVAAELVFWPCIWFLWRWMPGIQDSWVLSAPERPQLAVLGSSSSPWASLCPPARWSYMRLVPHLPRVAVRISWATREAQDPLAIREAATSTYWSGFRLKGTYLHCQWEIGVTIV